MAFPDIKLDTPIMENLQRATGAQWNSTLRRLVYPSRPEGNITVTLRNNYTTTIPNEELFLPRPVLLENGTFGEDPNQYLALVGNNTLAGEPRMFGRPFLSMNYFMADWSRLQIHLSPAIRERPSGFDFGIQLRPLCEAQNATTNATNVPSSATDTSNNTGAIAGGVVGGIVGLVLIIAVAILYSRRRRGTTVKLDDFAKPELEDTGVSPAMIDSCPKNLDELDSKAFAAEIDSASPQELPSALPELDFATPQEIDSDPRGEVTRQEKVPAAVLPDVMENDTPRGDTSIQSTPINVMERSHTDG
jgi:hypothetical protein